VPLALSGGYFGKEVISFTYCITYYREFGDIKVLGQDSLEAVHHK
jgi:hypothetical protein